MIDIYYKKELEKSTYYCYNGNFLGRNEKGSYLYFNNQYVEIKENNISISEELYSQFDVIDKYEFFFSFYELISYIGESDVNFQIFNYFKNKYEYELNLISKEKNRSKIFRDIF